MSCAASTSFTGWSWLPSISPLYHQAPHPTLALTFLVLTNVPFKYSSPIFTSGSLRALHLHGLPSLSLSLDRVLHLITSNPSLEPLALYFSSLTPPVLPLTTADISPVRLSKLHTLHVNGHPLLAHVVDVLVCPALEVLGMEVDMNAPINSGMGIGMGGHAGMGRDPVEETVISLVRRSGHPDITSLYIAYGQDKTYLTSVAKLAIQSRSSGGITRANTSDASSSAISVTMGAPSIPGVLSAGSSFIRNLLSSSPTTSHLRRQIVLLRLHVTQTFRVPCLSAKATKTIP